MPTGKGTSPKLCRDSDSSSSTTGCVGLFNSCFFFFILLDCTTMPVNSSILCLYVWLRGNRWLFQQHPRKRDRHSSEHVRSSVFLLVIRHSFRPLLWKRVHRVVDTLQINSHRIPLPAACPQPCALHPPVLTIVELFTTHATR